MPPINEQERVYCPRFPLYMQYALKDVVEDAALGDALEQALYVVADFMRNQP